MRAVTFNTRRSPVSVLIDLERLVPSYIVLLGDFNIDFNSY